jgi:hypothetical protein
MDQQVYTIPEYCAAEKVSRSKLYAEWAAGDGVEFFRRGAKIFITHEARLSYREKLERRERASMEARRAAARGETVEAHL